MHSPPPEASFPWGYRPYEKSSQSRLAQVSSVVVALEGRFEVFIPSLHADKPDDERGSQAYRPAVKEVPILQPQEANHVMIQRNLYCITSQRRNTI
jgi:hypothetical protein